VGGFDDEAFPNAGGEDTDLGLRLEREGLELHYDPAAVVDHYHPTDLPATLERMRRAGEASASLAARFRDWPAPRPPSLRHRLKAGVLTGLNLTGLRTSGLRHESWRFLCHEAHREAFWGVDRPNGHPLGIGRALAGICARDPATKTSAE
jgi:GT2 family glycosyltransferase